MRIKQADLEHYVHKLNKLQGIAGPIDPDSRKFVIGAYSLDYAYGGVQLIRYCNENGGCSNVFNCGFTTKRELYGLIQAYYTGTQVNLKL